MLSSEPLLPSALTELKTWADISRMRSTLCCFNSYGQYCSYGLGRWEKVWVAGKWVLTSTRANQTFCSKNNKSFSMLSKAEAICSWTWGWYFVWLKIGRIITWKWTSAMPTCWKEPGVRCRNNTPGVTPQLINWMNVKVKVLCCLFWNVLGF